MLVGHGSKARGFDRALRRVERTLKKERLYFDVRCGFLEAAEPSIPQVIRECVERGAKEVRLLPYFVLSGKHVMNDIPRIVADAAKKYRKDAKIVLCPYLGYHAKIVSIVKERLGHG